jgi:uncharacterized membrane protein YvbJ
MPISLAPIQPSAPPPVYCAECGCEVNPAAWLCATCGKNLHEPDATTSMRPYAPATSKNIKPDQIIGEYLFAILVCVLLIILLIASKMHRHPPESIDILLLCIMVLYCAFEFLFWLHEYLDRR